MNALEGKLATDDKLNKTPTSIGAQNGDDEFGKLKQSQNSGITNATEVVFVFESKFTCTLNFQLVYASNLRGPPK